MFFYVVVAIVLAKLAVELWLSALNRREVRRHGDKVPPTLAGFVDGETFRKSGEYTLAKSRFGDWETAFDAAVLIAVLWSGFLPWLFAGVGGLSASGAAWSGALFIVVAMFCLSLPSLPWDFAGQFKLEARFGFNKSSAGLWVADKLKGAAVGAVLGFVLLWLLLSLVGWIGEWWWVWAFGVLFGFQLLMMVLYPKLILPLFNKLTPLPEGDLRERLMGLSERTGFRASTIEVIDGSKRSGHSNAFFTGFGRFRRIVLFDTLIGQLEPVELEAVLAHEVGHYRKGHVPKMLAWMACVELAAFAAIHFLAGSSWFNPAFGFAAGELAPAFLLVGLLGGAVMFWFTPAGNLLSRKHEYEADDFARRAMGSAEPLVGALRKLATKNLSNLTPHPWFSGFYYSHPTLVEREEALGRGEIKE